MKTKDPDDYWLQMLLIIKDDVELIKNHILLQGENQQGIIRCKEILEEKKFITSTDIEKDNVLKTKYKDRTATTRLLDDLLEDGNEFKEIRAGRGHKRYIFKKEDEEHVRGMIRTTKMTNRVTTNKGEYEDIKAYFSNLDRKTIATQECYDLLRRDFQIKGINKVKLILKDLVKDGILAGPEHFRFRLTGGEK